MAIVMGSAGHIDHGKTSLIRALTGIDCDRLDEEKRRGITIELGFAFFDLPDGDRLGVVDVPGHERFVRTMAAGAAGIDFVLLVIAADAGVMPQTREHVDICSLLGIRHGLVALTKADMVDEELLELAKEDVSAFLQGSFLENAPLFPVSAVSGQGLDALRQAVFALAQTLKPLRRNDLFRLPVDRVFTMKGHGTVVTGTLISGQARTGDAVQLMPGVLDSRIRGMQSHGRDVDSIDAGRRVSINLHGLDVAQIARGDVVAHPGELFPSRRWLAGIRCLPSSPRALRHRAEIHFHHGAREIPARLYFYDRDRLEPGDQALAEIRFPSPLAGVYGDRCVIRAFSPLRTVGGGGVLIPLDSAPRRRDMNDDLRHRLLHSADLDTEALILLQLDLAGPYGCSQNALSVLTNLDSKPLEKALLSLSGRGHAVCYDKEAKLWMPAHAVHALAERCLEGAAAFHKREPLRPGLPKGALLASLGRKVPPKLAHFILEKLLKSASLQAEGDVLRLAGHKVSLASDQRALKDALRGLYEDQGLTPPNLKEALAALKVSPKEAQAVIQLLILDNTLVKINEEFYVAAAAMNGLKRRMLDWFAEHGDMTPGDFKELSGGLSRKYIIPLLEYFDKERVTIRVGDKRQIRGGPAGA